MFINGRERRLGGPIGWIAAALLSAGALQAQVPHVEDLAEVYGWRFCEVSWRTTVACPTRVALLDGGREVAVHPAGTTAETEHKVLLPLARERELGYSILLPDGARGAPRRLRPAAGRRGGLRTTQEPAAGGGIDLLASTNADAAWTLTLRRGGSVRTYTQQEQRAPTARFHIEKLGPDELLDEVVVTARAVDGTETAALGSILGNRALAAGVVAGLEREGLQRLWSMAHDKKSTREGVLAAFRELQARRGLDRLLEPAVARAGEVLADRALDAAAVRIPFAYALMRLGHLDWLARFRGWEPVTGAERELERLGSLGYPAEPPADAHTIYVQDATSPAGLGLWPEWIPERPDYASYSIFSDPVKREAFTKHVREFCEPQLRAVLVWFEAQGLTAVLAGPNRIEREWLGPLDGMTTIYLRVVNLEPLYAMYVRLNDEVMVPLRNSPEAFRGVAMAAVALPGGTAARARQSNWLACTLPTRHFRAGVNTWVVTAENLLPWKTASTVLFLEEIRVGPGARKGAD